MKILAIGDIVGTRAVAYLEERLWNLRTEQKIDFVIANGENASEIHGLSAADAKRLLAAGIDVITLGNHTYGKRDLSPLLESETRIIRPANYPAENPGTGYTVLPIDGWRILCINVSGRAFLDPLASPFDTVDKILDREAGHYDFAVMDIHAEATSEKLAIAHWFDGRVLVEFGTHTHVQTADEQILPNGSGYLTDLGMSGPVNGILGTDRDAVIRKFRTFLPTQFSVADGEIQAHGAIFEIDPSAHRVKRVTRVTF